jgi:hypothetical protein
MRLLLKKQTTLSFFSYRSISSHLDDYQSDDDDDYEDGETRAHHHPEQFSVVQRISVVQRKTADGDQVGLEEQLSLLCHVVTHL